MAVCAIRICVVWHHGFQTLPDPTVGCFSHTRTRVPARSSAPRACRDEWSSQHYNELLMPGQWRSLPTSDTACVRERVSEGRKRRGSTLPGPCARGLVGGLWVIVSRGTLKMMLKCHAQKDGRGFPTDTLAPG